MAKVLIVDDEVALLRLFVEALTDEGHEVISTSDCQRLTQLIEEQRPDVIVLDIRMDQYNGLDLLQDIRGVFYDLPVILCSADSSFKYDPRSTAADYYVVKSADLKELKVRIRMALEDTAPSVAV